MEKQTITDIVGTMQKGGIRIEVGGENFSPKKIIPSGSFLFDWMLGRGGLPSGRMIEMAGEEGGGKSTFSLVCAAAVRDYGKEVVWVDAEHSFDYQMAKDIGAENLIVVQPTSGEEAFTVVEKLLPVEEIGLVVVDSMAALVPQKEIDGDFGDANVALQARMLASGLRKLFVGINSGSPTIILINQIRDKIGQVWGDPTTTPGGRAPKHWVHIRMRVGKGPIIVEGTSKIGRIAHLSYMKSKMTSPDKTVDVPMLWGKGIDKRIDVLEAGILLGLVTKEGGKETGKGRYSFTWEEDMRGQYAKNLPDHMIEELRTKVRETLLPGIPVPEKKKEPKAPPASVKIRIPFAK